MSVILTDKIQPRTTGIAVTLAGDLDVTGAVSVAGTITYEDVTNVDSVGLITARSGVNLSGGQLTVGTGVTIGVAKTLNFLGVGNTFESTGDTIAVKIKGGGGGGLGTAINYQGGVASPFSYIDMQAEVEENMMLDSTKAGVSSSYIVTVIPTISVATGAAVTVGAGKTMIIDVLKIGDL